MITSRPTNASSSRASRSAIKTLSSGRCREEAKTPESEPVDQPTRQPPSRNGTYSPLSQRAQNVKDRLRQKSMVRAVLLKADGSSEEIDYSSSSKQANQLVNGRPTIVGELEDLGVIVVRSLNQSSGKMNPHTLPVPFCNKQFVGNYLLYRVDSQGNAAELTLKQYEKFVADNKTLTENARKNFDPIDNQEISGKSLYSSNSKLTLIYLRSEVDKKIRADFKKENGRNPSSSEIKQSVEDALQALVDELASRSSRMSDPDYDPKEDNGDDSTVLDSIRKIYLEENGVDLQDAELVGTLRNTQNLLQTSSAADALDDGRDWRLQLNDALSYVRERGRLDGRILAEKISETFYELNGREASLNELVDVFRRIKCELANEAEDDIREQEQSGQLSFDADPARIVDTSIRIVGQDLVSRARSSFVICKGREATNDELKDAVRKLALRLADRAIANSKNTKKENSIPIQMPRRSDPSRTRMVTSAQVSSKSGSATAYDVYFSKTSDKRARKNLGKAIGSFRKRNSREPSVAEMQQLRQFLAVKPQSSVIEFELSVVQREPESSAKTTNKRRTAVTKPTKVLVTPVKKKKSAARYNVYFEDDKTKLNQMRNERLAIQWFERFNNRAPTKLELVGLKQFTSADKNGLTEVEYNVPVESSRCVTFDDSKQTELDDDIVKKMKTDCIVTKRQSTKYTLNFEDDTEREDGDEEQAIKWFKRFNGRGPYQEEMRNIQDFLQSDRDVIDID